jgi:hypothetical protein
MAPPSTDYGTYPQLPTGMEARPYPLGLRRYARLSHGFLCPPPSSRRPALRRPCPCPPAPVLGPPWPQSPLHWSCYRPLPVRQSIYSPDPNLFNLTHGNPLSRPSIPLGKPRDPPPLSATHPLRPHPTPDGSDLLGKGFVDPELGLCTVSSLADPILLQPATGNLTPGLHLAPSYQHALMYSNPTGRLHTSSVPEAAQWVCTPPPPEPNIPPVPVPSAGVLSATRTPSRPIPSAPSAGVPSARKDNTPW